jgi:hypothetical protein
MNVWYAVFRTDSLTYTVAKALSWGGHDVCIWVVDAEQDHTAATGIQKRIRDTPRVTIVHADESRLPAAIDRLIVQVFPRPMESIRNIDALVDLARRITLVTAGDRSRSWRVAMDLQRREVRKFARAMGRIDRVVYKDGFYRRDLLGMFKPRHVAGFDVHSQFLHEEDLFRLIHANDWTLDAQRPILVNFIGCRDPDSRGHVLDRVCSYFPSANAGAGLATPKPMYWHEYPDSAPVGLDPREFVAVLTRSDFTLCPRGYSLVTHRPIEALLRGSIPIVAANELDLYAVELEDGVNCIAVADDNWSGAIERIAGIGPTEVVGMRTNIHAMFDRHLAYDVLAAKMRASFGVEG